MNKKAFTLMELLAVIIVLGIITTIIAPKVVNMLDESEKNTYTNSVRGLIKAATYKYSNNDIKGIVNEDIVIDYSNKNNTKYLEYNGEPPEEGKIHITPLGDVSVAVKYGDYCYKKDYSSDEITIQKYDVSNCDLTVN